MTHACLARSTALVAAAALSVFALDHATKAAADARILGGAWIEQARNPDLALGVASAPPGIELLLAGAALVAATIVTGRRLVVDGRRAVAASAGLVLGGSIGNLADRLGGSGVRDFIVGPGILFNVADVALVAGVLALVLSAHWRRPIQTYAGPPPSSSPSASSGSMASPACHAASSPASPSASRAPGKSSSTSGPRPVAAPPRRIA